MSGQSSAGRRLTADGNVSVSTWASHAAHCRSPPHCPADPQSDPARPGSAPALPSGSSGAGQPTARNSSSRPIAVDLRVVVIESQDPLVDAGAAAVLGRVVVRRVVLVGWPGLWPGR